MLIAAVTAIPLAACTSGASTSGGREAAPASASTTMPASGSPLNCASSIGTSTSVTPLRVVLGVVALPASPGYPALQTSRSGDGSGPLRLFAKTGLMIRPGRTFQLIVPAGFTRRLSLGWGSPGPPSHRVLVDDCPSTSGGWLAFAGGYWIDHPACVPVIVQAGDRQQEVRIGLGTACPGQRPPQGPTQG
jgi:hypothetical protein